MIEIETVRKNNILFSHTDHLGSTAYMTNKDGETCQFISYMPYGEAIIDEHNTDYENPFKFTGMELDPITGLYDHGARDRDPWSALWLRPDPLSEQFPMYSAYSYCYSNPVRFNDPTGLFGSEEEANNYHTELGGSAAKIWQAEDGLWHVTMSKDGTDYYRPSEGAEVVKYQSTWAKINTFFSEGKSDPANEGKTTVADVRAVATGMEAISDGADAAGTGLIITGVGAETGVVLYGIGTVTGYISDGLNVIADVCEGKWEDAVVRALGNVFGYKLSKKVDMKNQTSEQLLKKSIDKTIDAGINNSINKNGK